MAVTAKYSSKSKVLSISGDGSDNAITVSRNLAGSLLVNGGAVNVTGGHATVANTSFIEVFGQNGNDTITLDESNGALPAARLFGGAGNDVMSGGSGNDLLFGQSGDDVLLGKSGFDMLFGGANDDTLTGGDGDDQLFGESGNDRFIWNPGDDTDMWEGGDGFDTAEINGGNGSEQFTLTANGTRERFDRIDPAAFSIDMGTMEKLVLNMNGGDDRFSATGDIASLISVTVDGGAGADTILGSNGNDTLLGGEGNDFIDGQQGNDTVLLGGGDDVFQWDPGDGSDIVNGQDGIDEMLFNGSAAGEVVELSANGGRAMLTRNLGTIVMDTDGLEKITVRALAGADTVSIGDLGGTDVTQVNVDLGGTIGGATGDGSTDTVVANGSGGGDIIDLFASGTSVSVLGLAAQINIANVEGANDALVIQGQGGSDIIRATTLPTGAVKLILDGGAGDDALHGSQGADTLIGGEGNDFAFGDNGNDTAFLGAGDDVFQWGPGDGNDAIEGGEGFDRLLFFGANVNETVTLSANGGRASLFRDIAAVTMDLGGVEQVEYRALGGADNIVVNDLGGTGITRVDVDLGGTIGGDGAADTVTVNGSQAGEAVFVTGNAAGVTVAGLQATVNIFEAEKANDRLVINGQSGDDVINASGLEAHAIQLTINGGLGVDILIGSQGDDLVNGGDGNDVVFMGAGDDTFVWNPGDDNDSVDGEGGFDTLLFNGASVGEQIGISANGGAVRLTRDIAGVVTDLNGMESLNITARGGADTITVGDLTGTDVTEVNLDLSAAGNGGAGDGAADTVVIHATNGDDIVVVEGDAGGITVFIDGSHAVNITGFEAGNDRLVIYGLEGEDVIDASALMPGTIQLTMDAGAGNDIVLGSTGYDVIYGGLGEDVIVTNGGLDLVYGGPGDIII